MTHARKSAHLTAEEGQRWEDLYVYGTMPLEELAAMPGAPHISTLKERSARDRWVAKRGAVSERVTSRAHELTKINIAAILERHAEHGRTLQRIAGESLESIQPERLRPRDALEYMRVGIELEAQARGLNTRRLELTGQHGAPLQVQHDLSGIGTQALLAAYQALVIGND